MSEMRELIVTVRKIGEDNYLAVTKTDNGIQLGNDTQFVFTPDALPDIEPHWITNAREIAPIGRVTSDTNVEDTLITYGQTLYQFLFRSGVEADMEAFLKYNQAFQEQVQLTLALHENAALLWRVPWEYMHDGKRFVALTGRFAFSRRPEGLQKLNIVPTGSPLKILIIVSSPKGVSKLDTDKEIRLIEEALAGGVREGDIQIKHLNHATLEQISLTVRDFNPHIIHYAGHGVYDEAKGKSCLALEDEDGNMKKAYVEDIEPIVREAKSLRLLFLSGCQTAQSSQEDAFSGVATGLLEVGVPAVIAMQSSILDTSAIQLSKTVYRELARGENLTTALYHARQTLKRGKPGFDWGIPSLYLRASNMTLISTSTTQTPDWTSKDSSEFHGCLLDAYDPNSLKMMLAFSLDKELSHITSLNQSFNTVVFHLIGAAKRGGWIIELVQEAHKANPTNNRLKRFASPFL